MMADRIDRLITKIDQFCERHFNNLKSAMIEWMCNRFCAFPLEMGSTTNTKKHRTMMKNDIRRATADEIDRFLSNEVFSMF